jgi:hypothetical protein
VETFGPTLRDGVFELADLRWKRRRLTKFMQTKLAASTFDPRCASFDQARGLIGFACCLRTEPETCFEQSASRYLLPDKINYLKQKFPRSNYQSTSEWAEAIRNEIFLVLVPAIPGYMAPEPGEEEIAEALRQWSADCQVVGTIMQANELLEY